MIYYLNVDYLKFLLKDHILLKTMGAMALTMLKKESIR